MNADSDNSNAVARTDLHPTSPRVVRTPDVPAQSDYGRYRRYLRFDFFSSCAYCTMNEWEAEAIRFTIDHYEPQTARPDLITAYSNLMYACDECNTRKGNRYPPEAARKNGNRFFRPDEDIFGEHFSGNDMLLSHKSQVGYFTINTLDLNRRSLQRLREVRLRLLNCEKYISEGITALRQFRIDKLPQQVRARAQRAIKEALSVRTELVTNIDDILREAARSALLDDEPEDPVRLAQRNANLKQLEGLHPESWRAPNVKKRKK